MLIKCSVKSISHYKAKWKKQNKTELATTNAKLYEDCKIAELYEKKTAPKLLGPLRLIYFQVLLGDIRWCP